MEDNPITITYIPADATITVQVNDFVTKLVPPPGAKDTVILSIGGEELDRKEIDRRDMYSVAWFGGKWALMITPWYLDNLRSFWQTVAMEAIRHMSHTDMQTLDDTVYFWNAVRCFEEWKDEQGI